MQEPLLNGRYLLQRYLGKGGMGVVYKAADKLLDNRPVAIKEMKPGHLSLLEIDSVTAAFRREAMLLASLQHQNLPRIYDHFSENGSLYLVMDFINGDTLADIVEQAGGQGLLVEEVLLIAEQLCAVLEYLHAHQPPIIFRDLKPGNVMITFTGDHLYLIDFGIARLFRPEKLQDTLVSGTRGFAPPEQYRGATTERSDIYSFGATLHQLLTGLDPSLAINHYYFPPVRSINLQVPPQLEKLIACMVEQDAERRPPSILVVKRELQRIKHELQRGSFASFPAATGKIIVPEEIGTIGPPTATGKIVVPTQATTDVGTTLHSYQQHRDSVQTVAWSPSGKYLATGGRDKLVHIWDTATGDKIFTYTRHTTYVYSLAWSPDGKRVISTSFATAHVWDALTGENVVIYQDHLFWIYASTWSSDGQFIVTGGADGEVHFWSDLSGKNICKYQASSRVVKAVAWSHAVESTRVVAGCEDATAHSWDTVTGNAPLIYKGHSKEITCAAWSPNDRYIVTGSRDKTVQIWDACAGNVLLTYRGHAREVCTVAWSPDGKFAASAGEDKTVHIWDTTTGNTRYIYRCHIGPVCAIAWSPEGGRIASVGDDKAVFIWQAP